MIYDDGSYDETSGGVTYAYDTSGTPYSSTSAAGVYTPAAGFFQDTREQAKLGSFYPADKPWWEGVAQYGASRAIDAHFGPPATQGNTNGTYAGANGRTYTQGRVANAEGDGGIILLALAGLALYALAG